MSNLKTLSVVFVVAAAIAAGLGAVTMSGAAAWLGAILFSLLQPLLIGAVVAFVADVAVDELRHR